MSKNVLLKSTLYSQVPGNTLEEKEFKGFLGTLYPTETSTYTYSQELDSQFQQQFLVLMEQYKTLGEKFKVPNIAYIVALAEKVAQQINTDHGFRFSDTEFGEKEQEAQKFFSQLKADLENILYNLSKHQEDPDKLDLIFATLEEFSRIFNLCPEGVSSPITKWHTYWNAQDNVFSLAFKYRTKLMQEETIRALKELKLPAGSEVHFETNLARRLTTQGFFIKCAKSKDSYESDLSETKENQKNYEILMANAVVAVQERYTYEGLCAFIAQHYLNEFVSMHTAILQGNELITQLNVNGSAVSGYSIFIKKISPLLKEKIITQDDLIVEPPDESEDFLPKVHPDLLNRFPEYFNLYLLKTLALEPDALTKILSLSEKSLLENLIKKSSILDKNSIGFIKEYIAFVLEKLSATKNLELYVKELSTEEKQEKLAFSASHGEIRLFKILLENKAIPDGTDEKSCLSLIDKNEFDILLLDQQNEMRKLIFDHLATNKLKMLDYSARKNNSPLWFFEKLLDEIAKDHKLFNSIDPVNILKKSIKISDAKKCFKILKTFPGIKLRQVFGILNQFKSNLDLETRFNKLRDLPVSSEQKEFLSLIKLIEAIRFLENFENRTSAEFFDIWKQLIDPVLDSISYKDLCFILEKQLSPAAFKDLCEKITRKDNRVVLRNQIHIDFFRSRRVTAQTFTSSSSPTF